MSRRVAALGSGPLPSGETDGNREGRRGSQGFASTRSAPMRGRPRALDPRGSKQLWSNSLPAPAPDGLTRFPCARGAGDCASGGVRETGLPAR